MFSLFNKIKNQHLLFVLLLVMVNQLYSQQEDVVKVRGYTLMGEIGYARNFDHIYIDFAVLNGYRLNKFMILSLGTGIQPSIMPEETTKGQFFLDFRTSFLDKKITPVFKIAYGTLFNLDEFKKTSAIFKIGIGAEFNKNTAVFIGLNQQNVGLYQYAIPTKKIGYDDVTSYGLSLAMIF